MVDSDELLPFSYCSLVIDRIVRTTVHQFGKEEKEGKEEGDNCIRVRLSEFSSSCDYSEIVHNSLFHRRHRTLKNQMFEQGRLLAVDGSGRGYRNKLLEIYVGGTERSYVPLRFLVLPDMPTNDVPKCSEQKADGVELSPEAQDTKSGGDGATPTVAQLDRSAVMERFRAVATSALARTVSGDPEAAASRSVRDQVTKSYRKSVEPAVTQLIATITEQAEHKRQDRAYFMASLLERATEELASAHALFSGATKRGGADAALNASIVDSVVEFLGYFETRGSRMASEQRTFQNIVTALRGAVVNGGFSVRSLQDRLGVRCDTTVRHAVQLRRDLNDQLRQLIVSNQGGSQGPTSPSSSTHPIMIGEDTVEAPYTGEVQIEDSVPIDTIAEDSADGDLASSAGVSGPARRTAIKRKLLDDATALRDRKPRCDKIDASPVSGAHIE